MAYQLSRHLAEAGAEVSVLAPMGRGAGDFDSTQGFRIKRILLDPAEDALHRVAENARLARTLWVEIRELKPDSLLCIHWDPCSYLARGVLATVRNGPPYYLIAHGMELFQLPVSRPRRWIKARLRSFGLGPRKLFAVSKFTRNQVISLGVPPGRVKVIPNGVEWDADREMGPTKQDGCGPKKLLTVSRLVPRKGHETVLRALPKVLSQMPDLVYHIAGTGPERDRLEKLVWELGLEGKVAFHGLVGNDEKRRLLLDCDIFILPCRAGPNDFEGFGISFLEAMRYAIPVIAGNSGGVPDVVQNGTTGLLVNPDDADQVAEAILALLQNPDQAHRLGINARRVVGERYTWNLIAKSYLEEMSSGSTN